MNPFQGTGILEEIVLEPKGVERAGGQNEAVSSHNGTSHTYFESSLDDETITEDEGDGQDDEKHNARAAGSCDYSWEYQCPPTIEAAKWALVDLQALLKPSQKDKTRPLNPVLAKHLCVMKDFLVIFTNIRNN